MATIWVREFKGGVDVRRIPETSPGGTLLKGLDGHIDSGGQFEKRAKFALEYTLPAGTTHLAATTAGLYVFGHIATPGGIPVGVTYQRLQHPDNTTALSRVLSWDLYAGKLYVAAEFADGSRHHFYDGVRVPDWYDGRARVSFDVVGGGVNPATAAFGSFEVTGGTSNPGVNEIQDITIDGVSIISSTDIDHTGNNATTAAAIASAINSHTSSPDYSATSVGQQVIVTATTTGTGVNGKAIVVTAAGNVTVGNFVNMAGGAAASTSTLTDLKVDGISIINAPVVWATSNSNMASLIAAAINGFTSSPDYSATSFGTTVSVIAATTGTAPNGRSVVPATANGLVLNPAVGMVLAGGTDATGTYSPGTFVKTIGSRMNSVSGPNLHESGIQQPTKWTTDTTGAGVTDMSTQAAEASDLKSLAVYQSWVAVFAERVILIWLLESDPTLNKKIQILNNTGTASPQSVTQFGDNDLFYLDESGVRSIRARDASNAAATTDMGSAVDKLVTAKLRSLTQTERERVFGLINPTDKRFWLIMKDQVFVFTFFEGSKISAWSLYQTFYFKGNGTRVDFNVEAAVTFQRRMYVRGGDKIFCYGGISTGTATDATSAVAWLPFLDGGSPTKSKKWKGFDCAIRGLWRVKVALRVDEDGVNIDEEIGRYFRTTYSEPDKPALGESTHISLRLESIGEGDALVSSVAVHYEGDEEDAD